MLLLPLSWGWWDPGMVEGGSGRKMESRRRRWKGLRAPGNDQGEISVALRAREAHGSLGDIQCLVPVLHVLGEMEHGDQQAGGPQC